MTFNKSLVDNILEAIFPLPFHFGLTFECNDFDKIYDYEYSERLAAVDPEATLVNGASKLVITSPSLGGVVIKIPFNGFYGPDEDDIQTWFYFEGADCQDISNYCLAEYEKYQKLKTFNLDCFVAETFLYTTYEGFQIYLQEEVIPLLINIDNKVPSKKSIDIAKSINEQKETFLDLNWIANCIDIYGAAKVKHFIDYCRNIDLSILNDMHDSNYGYRLYDGTPAMLDYSDYIG